MYTLSLLFLLKLVSGYSLDSTVTSADSGNFIGWNAFPCWGNIPTWYMQFVLTSGPAADVYLNNWDTQNMIYCARQANAAATGHLTTASPSWVVDMTDQWKNAPNACQLDNIICNSIVSRTNGSATVDIYILTSMTDTFGAFSTTSATTSMTSISISTTSTSGTTATPQTNNGCRDSDTVLWLISAYLD
jgi:hypothetical protein